MLARQAGRFQLHSGSTLGIHLLGRAAQDASARGGGPLGDMAGTESPVSPPAPG